MSETQDWYLQEHAPWNPDFESLPPTPLIEEFLQLTLDELASEESDQEPEPEPLPELHITMDMRPPTFSGYTEDESPIAFLEDFELYAVA